jgi:hypothetical protein
VQSSLDERQCRQARSGADLNSGFACGQMSLNQEAVEKLWRITSSIAVVLEGLRGKPG